MLEYSRRMAITLTLFWHFFTLISRSRKRQPKRQIAVQRTPRLQGRCVAFVKAVAPSGKIVLTASAPGLAAGSISIRAAKPTPP